MLGLDVRDVFTGQSSFQVGNGGFDLDAIIVSHLLGLVGHQLFGLINKRVGVVAHFSRVTAFFIFRRVGFGFFHHPVNFVAVKRGATGNSHLLFLTRA